MTDWSIPSMTDFGAWAARLERVRAWEAEHPDLAAAWDEANRVNHQREIDVEQRAEEATFPRHLHACGVGDRTIATIVAGLRDTKALVGVREWLATTTTFLLMLGKAGGGKTVAAATALRGARVAWQDGGSQRWRYSETAGCFIKAGDLCRAVHEGSTEVLNRIRRVPWLVIDELGAEYSDQHGRWLAELDSILDARWEGRRRTVLTSNATAEQFKERYGERIASRIRGDGRIVDCGTSDLRAPVRGAA